MKYLFIGVTLALTFYAQLMMKSRALAHATPVSGRRIDYLIAMYTDIRVLSVLAAAGIAALSWTLAIERMPLTLAYPFMALTFAVVPLASVVLFRESLAPPQLVGIVLIVVGVALSTATR